MREILFRGKQLDNGQWVEGSLLYDPDLVHYSIDGFSYYTGECGVERDTFCQAVRFDTVGQYTGFKDKNGARIFEGDILQFCNNDGECTNYEVVWFGNRWTVVESGTNSADDLDIFFCEHSEVIGNVYDNLELLKECRRT